MDVIEQNLANWKQSLISRIPIAGLWSRNPVVYKWKALFRVWMLREAVFWRLHDLLTQSHILHQQGHELGARILLRGGIESLAILIYLNDLMQQVCDKKLDFHVFGKKTSTLLLGSRNNKSGLKSLNIVTILEKCEKRYPGLMVLYADLSESAHPSYEGLCMGYSKIDHEEFEAYFSNNWIGLYKDQYSDAMDLCMRTFYYGYDNIWSMRLSVLEDWIKENDSALEATKDDENR